MEIFDRLVKDQFIRTLSKNLREHYPDAVGLLQESQLAELISNTVAKLKNIDIERECDVERYLYLMCHFGVDIDTHERFRWIQEILFDTSLSGELRMDMLYQAAECYLDRVQ